MAKKGNDRNQPKKSGTEMVETSDSNASSRWPPKPRNSTIGPHVYRGEQFQNDDYKRWVQSAVRPITYDTELAAMAHAGNRTVQQQPEVFLATHGSPDKLPAMRRMLKLWNGPAAVSVLLPMPLKHPDAAVCRQRVLDYMRETVAQLPPAWTDVAGSPALTLTFIYATQKASNLHGSCHLLPTSTGLGDPDLDESLWKQQFEGKPYLDIYDAEYPVAELRQAALDQVPDDAFAFPVDPDFVFPPNAASQMAKVEMGALLAHAAAMWRERRERHAVVVPALQGGPTDAGTLQRCAPALQSLRPGSLCWAFDQIAVPADLSFLRHMEMRRQVVGYLGWGWPLSQACYGPAHAIHAAAPYSIHYQHPCGPFTIALKAALPPYDRRWRGNSLPRSSHTAHMATWGFAFHVGVGTFLFKLPGGTAPALKQQPEQGEVDPVYNDFWALPHVLTRVQLEEARAEHQHVCDVIPQVPPLPRSAVVAALERDGMSGRTCWEQAAPLEWWAVPGAQRPAVLPECDDAVCDGPAIRPGATGGLPPQAHTAAWALGGAVVAWAAFAWMWAMATRRGAARAGARNSATAAVSAA